MHIKKRRANLTPSIDNNNLKSLKVHLYYAPQLLLFWLSSFALGPQKDCVKKDHSDTDSSRKMWLTTIELKLISNRDWLDVLDWLLTYAISQSKFSFLTMHVIKLFYIRPVTDIEVLHTHLTVKYVYIMHVVRFAWLI